MDQKRSTSESIGWNPTANKVEQ